MTKDEMKNKYTAFITEISEILGLGKPIDILKLCATTDLFFQPLEKRIAELEKENAELKEQCLILADCNTCHSTCKNENVEMKKQLTKAKEIIKDYMTIAKGSHTTVCGVSEENRTINVLKLNKEAEQFLNSEVEE